MPIHISTSPAPMLTRMSDSSSGDLREPASTEGSGILAGLPHTRPQRASARRTASRSRARASSPGTSPVPEGSKGTKATARTTGKARASAKRPKSVAEDPGKDPGKTKVRVKLADDGTNRERAPRQGFEAEPDSLGPVQPPGSAELISSAAELAGELAKAGVNTGARVLKDFLSRLPG